MADVIGPNSYLPGRILRTENMIKGHNCDQCSSAEPPVEKPAAAAMIAETDSSDLKFTTIAKIVSKQLKRNEKRTIQKMN